MYCWLPSSLSQISPVGHSVALLVILVGANSFLNCGAFLLGRSRAVLFIDCVSHCKGRSQSVSQLCIRDKWLGATICSYLWHISVLRPADSWGCSSHCTWCLRQSGTVVWWRRSRHCPGQSRTSPRWRWCTPPRTPSCRPGPGAGRTRPGPGRRPPRLPGRELELEGLRSQRRRHGLPRVVCGGRLAGGRPGGDQRNQNHQDFSYLWLGSTYSA